MERPNPHDPRDPNRRKRPRDATADGKDARGGRDPRKRGRSSSGGSSAQSGAANNHANNRPGHPKTNPLNLDSEFICKMRFRNTLPPIPFDPKLLVHPSDPSRFVAYQPTSLETNYQHVLLSEPDLGIPIDLINPSTYKIPTPRPPLAPEDKLLVDPPALAAGSSKPQGGRRSESARPAVSWLRRQTEYISNDWIEGAKKPKRKAGKEDLADKTKRTTEEIAQAIELGFEKARETPVHPTNPSLKPVEIIPVFPDFDLWPNTYSLVMFGGDPSPQKITPDMPDYEERKQEQEEMTMRSVIKGFSTEQAGTKLQFVAYMTPKPRDEAEELLNKRREEIRRQREDKERGNGEEEEEGEAGKRKAEKGKEKEEELNEEYYQWVREYAYDVDQKALTNTYFFVWTPEAVHYNEISARVVLDKIKSKAAQQSIREHGRPAVVIRKERPLLPEEEEAREERRDMLFPKRGMAD